MIQIHPLTRADGAIVGGIISSPSVMVRIDGSGEEQWPAGDTGLFDHVSLSRAAEPASWSPELTAACDEVRATMRSLES